MKGMDSLSGSEGMHSARRIQGMGAGATAAAIHITP